MDKDFFMKSLHFPFALKLFASRNTDKHSCIIETDNLFCCCFPTNTIQVIKMLYERFLINKCNALDQLYTTYEKSFIKGMYGSRAVILLVLISDDVINWILKPYIQTNIVVYI